MLWEAQGCLPGTDRAATPAAGAAQQSAWKSSHCFRQCGQHCPWAMPEGGDVPRVPGVPAEEGGCKRLGAAGGAMP